MDGDGTEWGVGLRQDYERPLPKDERAPIKRWEIASGRVDSGNDFEVAKVIAIAALDAIMKDREQAA